jgi:membrane protease YdiL (CAAX protease family)
VKRIRGRWNAFLVKVRPKLANPIVRSGAIALFYLLLITLAELTTTYVDPQSGVIFHSAIMVGLLFHGSVIYQGPLRRFLILLSLAPLIRILSLSIPLSTLGLPVIYWYLVIGSLLAVAAFIAGSFTKMSRSRIGWSGRRWPLQLLIGSIGIGLGLVEYWILHPGPLAATMDFWDILISIFILLVFTGVLEEFIFRGLLQSVSMQLLGRFGLVYIAVLFSVLHMGYHSVEDLIFVLGVGLLFGWIVWKTHSLLGASLAHGIANVCLYIFFPFFIGGSTVQTPSVKAVMPVQEATPVISQREINATVTAQVLLPPSDRMLDNGEAGFLFTGTNIWQDSTGGWNGSFLWAYAAQSVPDVVVTWLPAFQGCGRYRVEAFIPAGAGLTDAARYRIIHRSRTETVSISQSAYNGTWAPLGNFEFEVGGSSYIQLSNLTGEDPKLMRWVGFDAVRWILTDSCSALLRASDR